MTPRDRTVLTVVAALALVAAAWFFMLAPVRKDAKTVDAQLVAAQARAQAAQANVSGGQRAQAAYRADYATVARLGKAVPVDDDVPSLVVQVQGAAHRARVDFRSIELSSAGGAPVAAPVAAPAAAPTGATGATGPTGVAVVPATQAAASALPPGAAVGAAGFPTMPFDFAFTGSFFHVQDLLARLDRFTQVRGDSVSVRGRLLTVDGFALTASPKGFPTMQASIHATAYLLPAEQGLTAGATTLAPATPGVVVQPAASSGAPALPTAPATAKGVGTP